MTMKKLPSQKLLKSLLIYNKDTGVIVWKERPVSLFKGKMAKSHHAKWNSYFAGRPALSSKKIDGYLWGAIFGVPYLAHRIIWKMETGRDPETVDHINGINNDNRWSNLRSVSLKDNSRNRRRNKDNTSGVSGVYFDKKAGKWAAQIRVSGKCIFLGRYSSFATAVSKRLEAEKVHKFHPNHGKAA